ncbi:MAG: protein kinase [Proteobacteria bacterium]|nr:protein kinase [Pseudomonadota bacterium]
MADVAALEPAEREKLFAEVEAVDPGLARLLRERPDVASAGDTFFPGPEDDGVSAADGPTLSPAPDDGATFFPGVDEPTLAPSDASETYFPGADGPTLSPTATPPPAPTSAREDSGQRLGRYRILSKLGEGGMGVVYLAEQDRPRRKVAIKVIRATAAHQRRRFEWEAEVLARLDHPGIARILEAHADPDQSWFAMEHIDGATLDEAAEGLETAELLTLLADIADAVHHAHLKGVVHRDLKPGNILVTDEGQPKVLDFGIARAMDDDDQPGHTRVGQIIGTPQYMSPEQATIGGGDLDGRSDVYALGVIAYELLAGRPPYTLRNKPLPEMVRIITEVEAPPLGRLDRALAGDITVIVAKCLEKDAAQRYQSAWDVAEDLRRYLRDEPILARPATTTYQLTKFARRNRTLTATLVGLAVVLVVSAVLATALWQQAESAARTSDAARHELQTQADMLLLQQASNELVHDPTRSVAWLRRLGPDAEWNRAFAVLLEAETLGVARHVLRGHLDEVRGSAFSAGGQWLATAGYDETVRVWNLETGESRILGRHDDDVKTVAFTADGRLWSSSRDRTARIWDVSTGEYTALEGHGAKIEAAALHPLKPWMITGSGDGTAWLWNSEGEAVRNFGGHEGSVDSVAFSPDGAWLATAGVGGRIGIWPLDGGEGRFVDVHEGDVRSLHFNADVSWLVSTSRDGTAAALRMGADGVEDVRLLRGHQHEVRRSGFVADGRVVTGARDGELRIWDLETGEGELLGVVGGVVRHLDVSPDLEVVGVGVEDGSAWLFDLATGGVRHLVGHSDAVRHVTFSSDGEWLASSSSDGSARIWRVRAEAPSRFSGHTRRVMDLSFSPDGQTLASGSSDYTARLWDVSTGRSSIGSEHDDEVEALGWSEGRLVSASRDRTVRIDGRVLQGRERIDDLAVSPDGRWAAGAMRGRGLSVWEIASGELRELEGHRSRIHAVTFAEDGRLATAGKDGTVRIWDVEAGTFEIVAELDAEVGALAWSSDGRIAAGSFEGAVWTEEREWTVGDGVIADLSWSKAGAIAVAAEGFEVVVIEGDAIRRLEGHTGAVTAVDWAEDTVVSVSEDGSLRLWRGDWSLAYLGVDVPLRAVAVSPDAMRVAAAGDAGVVHLWPTHPPQGSTLIRERLEQTTSAVVLPNGVLRTP